MSAVQLPQNVFVAIQPFIVYAGSIDTFFLFVRYFFTTALAPLVEQPQCLFLVFSSFSDSSIQISWLAVNNWRLFCYRVLSFWFFCAVFTFSFFFVNLILVKVLLTVLIATFILYIFCRKFLISFRQKYGFFFSNSLIVSFILNVITGLGFFDRGVIGKFFSTFFLCVYMVCSLQLQSDAKDLQKVRSRMAFGIKIEASMAVIACVERRGAMSAIYYALLLVDCMFFFNFSYLFF